MEELIPVVNKLQEAFAVLGVTDLELPQLVMVGTQSSGKSSVLENIVGRDFLPRGAEIVTRRPLLLQLINTGHDRKTDFAAWAAGQPSLKPCQQDPWTTPTKQSSEQAEQRPSRTAASQDAPLQEWGEFAHLPGKRFTDFERIKEEIMRETTRLVGKNKGVSDVPISLKLFSPSFLNLSLVDLPGLTRVPVGDQPRDIEARIRSMVMRYIENPLAIVVAVSAANVDLATSEALQMAKQVDPLGKRTLGVVTKMDLMDKGTDALDVLAGRVIPLMHGYVGMINRSQADIQEKKTIQEALRAERDYFACHPTYRGMAARLGTPYLTQRLRSVLMMQIHLTLPALRQKLNHKLTHVRAELLNYGGGEGVSLQSPSQQGPYLLSILSKFCSNFNLTLEGRSLEVSTAELYGGARISYVFHDLFGTHLASITPFDTLSDHDIRTALRNANGPRPTLFISEIAFELLVKKQISRLRQPALECVDVVYDELKRVAMQSKQLSPELARFPKLRDSIVTAVGELLSSRIAPTKEMINHLLEIELAYINTKHPDFIGGAGAVAEVMGQSQPFSTPFSSASATVPRALPADAAAWAGSSFRKKLDTASIAGDSVKGASHNTHARYRERTRRDSRASNHPPAAQQSVLNIFLKEAPVEAAEASMPRNEAAEESLGAYALFNGHAHSKPAESLSQNQTDLSVSMSSLGVSTAYSALTLKDKPLSATEQTEVTIVRKLIDSYFNLVKKNIQDSVPKTVMHFLVNHVTREIRSELVRKLYKESAFASLLEETQGMVEKRAACAELLQVLEHALITVSQIRDCDTHSALE